MLDKPLENKDFAFCHIWGSVTKWSTDMAEKMGTEIGTL
jgi:hypothetical protein